MTAIFAAKALLPDGWRSDVRLTVESGRIGSVEEAAMPQPGDARVDALLPALSNLHSHTFQRAMAGMTETRGPQRDSFWTWRVLMYRFLDHLAPDDVEAIAALALMEMQESGFAAVAEFHYLHHQPGGVAYTNRAELGWPHRRRGAGNRHWPHAFAVLYRYGGLDKRPLQGGQLRFGNDLDAFLASRNKARRCSAQHCRLMRPSGSRRIRCARLLLK